MEPITLLAAEMSSAQCFALPGALILLAGLGIAGLGACIPICPCAGPFLICAAPGLFCGGLCAIPGGVVAAIGGALALLPSFLGEKAAAGITQCCVL